MSGVPSDQPGRGVLSKLNVCSHVAAALGGALAVFLYHQRKPTRRSSGVQATLKPDVDLADDDIKKDDMTHVGLSDTDFVDFGEELMRWIITYRNSLVEDSRSRSDVHIRSTVSPGYLSELLPSEAPLRGEPWANIMADIDRVVLPGLTHWESPGFFAYFKPHASYATVLAEMLSAGINAMGFSWIASPVVTEMETITLNWVARALNLPKNFIAPTRIHEITHQKGSGLGGGVIQGSAGESFLVALVAARAKALQGLEGEARAVASSKLVVYLSDQTHSVAEKGCRVLDIDRKRVRLIPTRKSFHHRMETDRLVETMAEDMKNGLTPFFVCLTLGTTSSGAIDNLEDTAFTLREKFDDTIWIHVDGAWGAAFCVCPEFQVHLRGVELTDSLVMNAHKQLLASFDLSCMWVRDRTWLLGALSLDPELEEYLRNQATESGLVIDYKDWQIPLGRRFRSLKLWFIMRSYGIQGLQHHLRKGVVLAQRFQKYIEADSRFELYCPRAFSLVCFQLKVTDPEQRNTENKRLLDNINETGKVFLINTVLAGEVVLRLACGGIGQDAVDIDQAWTVIQDCATAMGYQIQS